MRSVVCRALVDLYARRPFVFLTGDLGFMALEPLQSAMGKQFINAGVAEQNMVSVAAGVASTGLQTWVYSIAPFVYARPFEQIRNDVCLHNADVKLVGNGGGYGYGSMGSTHHALEDYGVLLGLQNMNVYVPAFAEDVPAIVSKMSETRGPAYLRLGRCERPAGFALPPYAAWRKVLDGKGSVMIIVGPLAGGLADAAGKQDVSKRPEIWVLSELSSGGVALPDQLLERARQTQHMTVVEEHVAQGGVGQMIAHRLLTSGIQIRAFDHHCARGYPSGQYGSQTFHRNECGLDSECVLRQALAGR